MRFRFLSPKLLFLSGLCIALAAIVSCSTKSNSETDTATLAVSIEPQRYLLEQIAGPKWNVISLLDKGADPENFDPSLSAMRSVMDSRAFFSIGTMPFENTLIEKLRANNPDIKIFDSSQGITTIRGTHSRETEAHHDSHHAHDVDPHIWSSITNARTMAANMAAGLSDIDPDNAPTYQANYRNLDARLDSIQTLMAKELQPAQENAFIIWHPSLSYFARDFGLRQIPLGVENKESSAEAFRKKIELARHSGAKVMIVQPELDSSRSGEIAAQAGAQIVEANLLDYDFINQLQIIAAAIAKHSPISNK